MSTSIPWGQTALVFPGQGSQGVGMGAEITQQYAAAAETFQEADQVLGYGISKLCFDGPPEQLDQTNFTQPALYLVGVAYFRALEALLGKDQVVPCAAAGHSLGEFTALTAAGALRFADGLRLVQRRADLMREAGAKEPGAMAALLGATLADAEAICAQATADAEAPVVIGNDNCPGQIVISGAVSAVERALVLCKEKGIKRAIKLAVSVAAHSPLMQSAAADFQKAVASTPFAAPRFPVIGNVGAVALRSAGDIVAELNAQLTQAVRWTDSVGAMQQLGAMNFYELGTKDVLCGLIKRIMKEAQAVPINTAAGLAAFTQA
jgi:[acyl-carrier-protein] S-malonyltransferase